MGRLVTEAVHPSTSTRPRVIRTGDGRDFSDTATLEGGRTEPGSVTAMVDSGHGASGVLPLLVTCVSGAGAILFAIGISTWTGDDLAALLVLALLAMAAERFDLNLYGDSRVSLAFVPIFGAILLAGISGLAVVVPVAILGSALGQDRALHKTAFNFGALMIAGAASLLVIFGSGMETAPSAWPEVLPPALLAAGINFTVNSIFVTLAISLSNGKPLGSVWNEHFAWLGPHYLVMGLLGLSLVAAYEIIGLWGIAVFVAPPLMMRLSLKQYIDRTTDSVLQLRRANEELRTRHEQLLDAREQAATDALTGLGNHRAFHERSQRQVREANRLRYPLSLIMLDIDGFKAINDSRGHQEGDRLLSDLAEVLTEVVSRSDTYRYGGDEFAILLPRTGNTSAAAIAERLRRAVVAHCDQQRVRITISLGVASFPNDARSAEELIYQADAAMYWAKSTGKNRVGHGHRVKGATTMRFQADGTPS